MPPRFSIITATKNRGEWLPWAIQSVLDQDFQDWEHVIIDGSDNWVENAASVQKLDDRHRYVVQPNSGPAEGFQLALEQATGEIVHPLSDDDELAPGALASVHGAFGETDWLYGKTLVREEKRSVYELGFPGDVEKLPAQYLLGGAVYWRKTLTDQVGGFDPAFDGAADYDLYWRFADHSAPAYVPDVLYLYTLHAATDSNMRAVNQSFQAARIRSAHAAVVATGT